MPVGGGGGFFDENEAYGSKSNTWLYRWRNCGWAAGIGAVDRRFGGLCSGWHVALRRSLAHGSDARLSTEVSGHALHADIPQLALRCMRPLLMLWTAPPPARECHRCGCC